MSSTSSSNTTPSPRATGPPTMLDLFGYPHTTHMSRIKELQEQHRTNYGEVSNAALTVLRNNISTIVETFFGICKTQLQQQTRCVRYGGMVLQEGSTHELFEEDTTQELWERLEGGFEEIKVDPMNVKLEDLKFIREGFVGLEKAYVADRAAAAPCRNTRFFGSMKEFPVGGCYILEACRF